MADPYYGTSEEQAGLIQALLSGEQGLPTAQPNYAEPVVDYLNGWDPSMVNTTPLNVLSDPGAAYDPSMVYRFDTGDKVGVPNAQGGFDNRNAAPTVFQPGQQYVMVNPTNGDVIGRASRNAETCRPVERQERLETVPGRRRR